MKTIDFEVIDSTNTYSKKHYQELEDMTFISSKLQTSGHGRNNREWKSENGTNLLFSLFVSNKLTISKYKELSIISAYTVLKVLEKYGLKDLSIKWPNDVYVKDKKICGILLEALSDKEIKCLIIGVGINVNQKEFNEEYLHSPTSINLELNKKINLDNFKNDIYSEFIRNIERVNNNESFYDEIVKYDYLKGKEVYAIIDNTKQKVLVKGIDLDYSIKIQLNYQEINLDTGEITFHED